jgi:beta-glucanase (GH16 family)
MHRTMILIVGTAIMIAVPVRAQYQLVWQEEFDGNQLDSAKWTPQIGTGCPDLCGWGNNELQYYRAENATVAGGFLTITAKEESFGNRNYTSARLRTKNLGDWKRGRFEMRAKMPIGQGIWPAFWMLPTDEVYGGWAASGEIDILEYLGHDPDRVFGTIHYGGPAPENQWSSGSYTLPSGTFHDDFHTFALEWDLCEMRWYVDGNLYSTKRNWYSTNGPFPAPFDQRFHLLLNMAVGGNLPGPPDATTEFPQEMVVDWVRVWQVPGVDLDPCVALFDGMEHGNPFGNGWFQFGGGVGGGGIDANFVDLPPVDACNASLQSGWGSGGTPGFYGGFGRTNLLDLGGYTHFDIWLLPDTGQDYTLEINLQDDDNGDDFVPGNPDGADDEFQYDVIVSPTGPHVISGAGWQHLSIPLADFFDDNSYHWGGNGVWDPVPTSEGGNGQLVNVVITILGNDGSDATFRTDHWAFTRRTGSVAGRVWDDLDGNGVDDAEPGLGGVGVELFDPGLAAVVATDVTSPNGDYSFDDLLGGVHEVRVDTGTLPVGALPTFDSDGIGTPHVFALELVCDEPAPGRDFGYRGDPTSAPGVGIARGVLGQNVPNPFAPQTVIEFELGRAGFVELDVYDVSGRRVTALVAERRPAGPHRVVWDGRDDRGHPVSAGVYFYALKTAEGRWVKRMSVLR